MRQRALATDVLSGSHDPRKYVSIYEEASSAPYYFLSELPMLRRRWRFREPKMRGNDRIARVKLAGADRFAAVLL
ncbi:hypothetical protein Y032_0024g1013 [Ancylostoma ceylanicum]|nr:hypothetical protein Y032_0024g1013 [Ancylostoma ceylanicum]